MKQRILLLSAAVCAGGMLVVPVWPQFISGAITAPYEDTLRNIARGQKANEAILAETETALRVARKWSDDGRISLALGGIRFIDARNAQSAAEQRTALTESIVELKHGLRRAPARAYAWLLLARAERARYGATAALEKYLSLSLSQAPWEHRLVMPRIEIALSAWSALSPAFKSQMRGQFERAVDTAPVALARATRRNFALRGVRQMLADSPLHLERFTIVYLSAE